MPRIKTRSSCTTWLTMMILGTMTTCSIDIRSTNHRLATDGSSEVPADCELLQGNFKQGSFIVRMNIPMFLKHESDTSVPQLARGYLCATSASEVQTWLLRMAR